MKSEEFKVGHIPVYRYTGDKAPDYAVILLPGVGGYGGYYPSFAKTHVERGLEIWAMDPPGHGRSAQPRGRFTAQAYMDDVVALAAHITAQTGLPILTLGSSLGSGAAFLAMEQSPHLVGGIGMGITIPAAGWQAAERKVLASDGVDQLLELFGGSLEWSIFKKLDLENNYGDSARVAKIMKDPMVTSHYELASWRSYLTYDPPVAPKDNTKPFLMIVGGADPMFPRASVEEVFANIGGPKTLRFMEGRGHQLMFECGEEFSNIIDDWAREQLNLYSNPPAETV